MTNADAMEEPPLLLERHGNVALVKLNRPHRMNTVNQALRSGLTDVLHELNRDGTVAAVVLAGSGARAFCAGQDLNEAAAVRIEGLVASIEAQHAMYRAVRSLDKPCVAAIHGVAAGAGFQIALCADIRVCTPAARIGQPEVKAGLASIVGTYLMTLHLGMGHNVELSLGGELISGRRAYEIGLVHELTQGEDAGEVLGAAIARAERLAKVPVPAMRASKQRMRALTQPDFDEACVAGIRYQLECYSSGAPQAAIAEFLAARGRAA